MGKLVTYVKLLIKM